MRARMLSRSIRSEHYDWASGSSFPAPRHGPAAGRAPDDRGPRPVHSRVRRCGRGCCHGPSDRNITIGPPVVRSLRRATDLLLDVHLMIEDPDQYIVGFVDAGADVVTVHQIGTLRLGLR